MGSEAVVQTGHTVDHPTACGLPNVHLTLLPADADGWQPDEVGAVRQVTTSSGERVQLMTRRLHRSCWRPT